MKKRGITTLALLLMALPLLMAGGSAEKATGASGEPTQVESISWWDHYLPLAPLHQQLWDEFTEETGIKVEYTQYDPAKQNEALLLAYRSNQTPDVFSMTFSGNPEPQMYKDGWFSPLTVSIDELPEHLRNTLFEGTTLFDGKVYSFPTMNNLNHNVPTWYLKSLVNDAGYSEMPSSFDDFRKMAKDITQKSGGKVYGVILPIAFTTRMNDSITDWVNASGGPGQIDWKTGEYQFASPYYFDVFEFLVGLKDDGSVHPSSVNMDMRQARERWAAGEAAALFDGCWNIGVVNSGFQDILDDVAVAEPVRKDGKKDYLVYKAPPKGNYYMSSQTKVPEEVTKLLLKLTSDEYYVQLADKMDQPPLKLEAVKLADVHPTYTEVIDIFNRTMAYQPDPLLRNPDVAAVYAEMRDIHPNPAEILQGYYSGAIKDWKSELVKYNTAMTNERNRAIKKAQDAGMNVSINDWIFPNWEYGINYTTDKY